MQARQHVEDSLAKEGMQVEGVKPVSSASEKATHAPLPGAVRKRLSVQVGHHRHSCMLCSAYATLGMAPEIQWQSWQSCEMLVSLDTQCWVQYACMMSLPALHPLPLPI